MKLTKYLLSLSLAAAGVATFSSCEDMLDKGNSYVIYAETDHLTSSSDTVTSVVGILNKLQAIAVRTNLLGEVRADLVNVKENGTLDLKNLALFDADVTNNLDENQYNVPRDYYAVINNCNYFLANVDDSLPEIHTDGMKYMFERETAAVHCIRAWTYLQCVLAYGKIPFVTEPVLSEADSKKSYPMYGIDEICDYFINDLKPYVDISLPDYNSFDNSDVTPKMCFFPANLVLGDMYLWKAASDHDVESAKNAAKSYYDFIEWDLSGKKRSVTNSNKASWNENDLYEKNPLRSASGSFSFGTSGTWGATSSECITAIAMDSSSATGYYNELRNLYNYTQRPEFKEACIVPSDAYKELSRSQIYVGYDRTHNDTIEVTSTDLEEEAIEAFMEGDLRFASFWSTRDRISETDEIFKEQSITKHRSMNVMVYRIQQVYLRLAEALNYAGYPRFARQILTMGLSRTVIDNEVQPYYTSSEDSTFLKYFDFNDSFYMPYASDYTTTTDEFGLPIKYKPSLRNDLTEVNMWGIHSRGSGMSFMNEKYIPVIAVDSAYAPYPTAELNAIGDAPVITEYQALFPDKPKAPKTVKEPSTWAEFGDKVLTMEEYGKYHSGLSDAKLKSIWQKYIDNDSVGKYSAYMKEVEAYDALVIQWNNDTTEIMKPYWEDCAARSARIVAYKEAWQNWHSTIYANPKYIEQEQIQMDKAILDEQALELSYEGNRYYDLMRRALWYDDPKYLDEPISAARPEVAGKLLNKKNWFLHYKGQIGY